jgi:hypothetical protein
MNKMPSALPFKLRIVRERWYHRLLDRMRPPQLSPGKVVAQVQFDCTVQEGSDGHYHLRPHSPEILDAEEQDKLKNNTPRPLAVHGYNKLTRLAATLEALRVKKATTTMVVLRFVVKRVRWLWGGMVSHLLGLGEGACLGNAARQHYYSS